MKPTCTIQHKKLKISYNQLLPNFDVENDKIVHSTIEGVAIQSFIDRNNLSTEFIDEKWTWGRKDLNGRFDGVIGRVSR